MLEAFWFDNTNLCVPVEPAFQSWLQGIPDMRGTGCTNVANVANVANAETTEIPAAFSLAPNYPNPFNPTTQIRYALPQRARVHLTIYDVLGRRVVVLVDAEQPAGWHEVTFEAGTLPSGIYLSHLEASGFEAMHRMLLLR